MARVFTTSFQFRGVTYTAIITQVDGSIYIRVNDPALQETFPLGELRYNHEQGLELEAQGLTDSQDLIVAVLSALKEDGIPKCSPKPSLNPSNDTL
jgi:patatin-like phospholipase/acyl hydrolase